MFQEGTVTAIKRKSIFLSLHKLTNVPQQVVLCNNDSGFSFIAPRRPESRYVARLVFTYKTIRALIKAMEVLTARDFGAIPYTCACGGKSLIMDGFEFPTLTRYGFSQEAINDT